MTTEIRRTLSSTWSKVKRVADSKPVRKVAQATANVTIASAITVAAPPTVAFGASELFLGHDRTMAIIDESSEGVRYLAQQAPRAALRYPGELMEHRHPMRAFSETFGPEIAGARARGLHNPVPPKFRPVSDRLYAGSRLYTGAPTDDILGRLMRFEELHAKGITSIVNLRLEDVDNDDANRGFERVLHLRIPDNTAPTDKDIIEFLNFMTKKGNGPTYVHCDAGAGRTKTMVAAYLIIVEGRSSADVLKQWSPVLERQDVALAEFIARFEAGERLPGFAPETLPINAPVNAKNHLVPVKRVG